MQTFTRLRLTTLPQLQHVFRRNLTSTETATALRPFFFVVHPDLFGQYPKERAVNENSLKQLNSYLDSLYNKKRVYPASITFFVRKTSSNFKQILKPSIQTTTQSADTKKPMTFREVRINLLSAQPREIVKSVLRSCNLSLDYVESKPDSLGKNQKRVFYRGPDMPQPSSSTQPKKPQITISKWLRDNLPNAHYKQEAMGPIHQQICRLRTLLLDDHGLLSITCHNYWGPVQHRACLISLLKICEQHGKRLNLRGRSLVFANDTGLTLDGDIMLRSDDVPNNWVEFLNSLEDEWRVLMGLPLMEKKLSSLLNGVQVARWRGLQSPRRVTDYSQTLAKLVDSCQTFWHNNPDMVFDRDLRDIELVVACASGPLAVSKEGQILVPYSCPGYLLIDFLQRNVSKAKKAASGHAKVEREIENLVEQVETELGLGSLTYDTNLDVDRVRKCCHHLLQHPDTNFGVSLQGTMMHISSFYSVMSDGLICIPWNWVGMCDND